MLSRQGNFSLLEAATVGALSAGAVLLAHRYLSRPDHSAASESTSQPAIRSSATKSAINAEKKPGWVDIRPDEPGQVQDDVSSANMAEVFVRGINKKATVESITEHFSGAGQILSLRWASGPKTERKGYCWIIYETVEAADRAVLMYNHSSLHGTNITIQKNLFSTAQSSTVIPRHIRVVNIKEYENYNKKAKSPASVSYSRNGLMVNGVEYPTPNGTYLKKLLEKTHRCNEADLPLLDLLLDNSFGNNKSQHSKELSESMAMVNAVKKLASLSNESFVDMERCRVSGRVVVYVLADGKLPYTASCIALYSPSHWRFVSIDPIMDFDCSTLGEVHGKRVSCESKMSQDYVITASNDSTDRVTSIVIACHSHAPLQEFWDRLSGPKFCVNMPCCKAKEWSHLTDTPVCEYEDYEVFSPKRLIKLYYTPAPIHREPK